MDVDVVKAHETRLRVKGAVITLKLGEHRRETFLLKQKLILELPLA